jgi:hypothetical protein
MCGGVVEFHDGIMTLEMRVVNRISRIIEFGSHAEAGLTGYDISITLDIWNQNKLSSPSRR